MFKKLTIGTLICTIILFTSCNQYQKAPSGMKYKITKGKSTVKIKNGDYIKLNFKYTRKRKDSLLNSTFGKIPVYFKVDTNRIEKFTLLEIITKCGEGDKVEFILNIDTLVKMGLIRYSPVFKAKDEIIGNAEIEKIFSNEEEVTKDNVKELDKYKAKEIAEIKEYIKKKKINAIETPEGVMIQIEKLGDTTNKVISGKLVAINYEGYLLKDDSLFEKNTDQSNPNNKPLSFVVDKDPIIAGWVIGLKYFGKGGKGKIFIPSLLAYGQQGSPPVIPAFSNLYFNIEVVDVTNAPPAPKQTNANQMPGGDIRDRR